MATFTYISLFTGVAGLDEGLRAVLPAAKCVCYCELEIKAVEILAARIAEGSIDDAPVWSDCRTFPSELFSGRVDAIIGGFPCQDMSVAGAGAGIEGERSGLWFDFLRIIAEVGPAWVWIENVPGIFRPPGSDLESDDEEDGESAEWVVRNIDAVLGPLSDLGYDASWMCLRASDVGAAHKRNRVFILAYRKDVHGWAGVDGAQAGIGADGIRGWGLSSSSSMGGSNSGEIGGLADAGRRRSGRARNRGTGAAG